MWAVGNLWCMSSNSPSPSHRGNKIPDSGPLNWIHARREKSTITCMRMLKTNHSGTAENVRASVSSAIYGVVHVWKFVIWVRSLKSFKYNWVKIRSTHHELLNLQISSYCFLVLPFVLSGQRAVKALLKVVLYSYFAKGSADKSSYYVRARYQKRCHIRFSASLGGKNGGFLIMRMQVILDTLFPRSGSTPNVGRAEGKWTTNLF